MEPPSWWVGMHHKQVQLMVHGKQIADLEPSISYPGVRLVSVTRVPNHNYLFLDLEIAADAAPGKLDIRFVHGSKVVTYPYQLQARASGSAERAGFNSRDVIYNLMPDRFANGNPGNDNTPDSIEHANRQDGSGRHGGDIQGMAEHLDYLAGMGYTQIWPTPLLESNMPHTSYHGYAATNLYRIDPRYGSNEEYRSFVAKARTKGLGVLQDMVPNHIGSSHWWMRDMPMADWITNNGKFTPTAHHRMALSDPYASQADKRDFTTGWFSDGMPDMNQANPYVSTYLTQNVIWWIEYAGLSGLRVDTYGYSDTVFVSEWTRRVLEEYPHLNLVGEEWSMQVPTVAKWQQGQKAFNGAVPRMPSMMDFPLNDVLRRGLAAADGDEYSLTSVYETLAQDDLYANPGNLVLFEGNHDMSRLFSALNGDEALFRMATAFILTAPRVPQFYAGTEVLMTSTVKGRDDASYRHDFPGGWAGDTVNAFTGTGLTPSQAAAQAYLKKLLNWRKTAEVIHHGRTMQFGPEKNVYVYFRYNDSKKIMVILNKNKADTPLELARFAEMLGGVHAGVDVATGARYALDGSVTLPARTALILELQ
jgi:glycosidase